MKNVDQVLERHPDHPESLAMKALILNAQKKKKEAFGFIQKALFKNLGNFTCWHVYGILHRSNKNYDDARKAYLNALKYDPDNQNVLRDLGQLQIQLRDYEGYSETRRVILVSKSGLQLNWVAYAVALYLNKNYLKALEVLQSFEKTLKENKEKLKNSERSELTLFEARVHEAMGNYQKAVELINRKTALYDQISKHERLAAIYIKLGDKDKAVENLEELLQLNSSNYNYYFQILEAHGYKKSKNEKYTQEEQQKIKEIIEFYEEKLPKATAHKRILLKLLHGDLFKQRLNQYAKPLIIKGVPPLIKDLKEFYSDQDKVKIIEELLLSNLKSMEENSTLVGDEEEQDPTVYLWLLYFTAQHYYFLKDLDTSLKYINQAIDHTPTVIELYIIKAKIYKRSGDVQYASKLYDEARKLDLADRYLNAVSSRFKIRADQLQDAEDTMALFSKEGNELNVHEMQCMWYEVEVGNSHLRQGNYRLALKNYNYVEKHFEQIFEDQFDFHLYAIRKYTLNSYLQMIEMEDNIYQNKNAVNASLGIIRTMNKAEKNKEEEAKKLEPEFETYKNSKEYKEIVEDLRKRDEDDEFRNDFDPQGYELYQKSLNDPLGKALEFSVQVVKLNPEAKELHAKVIPLFLKKNKLLLALKSLLCLVEHHPTYEKTTPMKLRFLSHWFKLTDEQRKAAIPDDKQLQSAIQDIEGLGVKSESEFEALAEQFLKGNSASIEHVHEYIKLRMTFFEDKNGEKFEDLAVQALTQEPNKNDKVEKVVNLLRRVKKAGASGDKLKEKAKEVFKLANCLQKSRDMVLTLMSAAHAQTTNLMHRFQKKGDYLYKHTASTDHDYERDILLEEDADDYHAFDYEDPYIHSQKPMRKPEKPIKLRVAWKEEGDKVLLTSKEKEPIKERQTQQNDYDSINQVVSEIEKNLINEDDEGLGNEEVTGYTNNHSEEAAHNAGLHDNFLTEEDHDQFINELDNMIKYDEDDEEVGILDGV